MQTVELKRSIWINAPRERVWLAVTDPAQIQAWFAPGTPIAMKGNRVSITINDQEIEVAEVEIMDPPRQLTTRGLPERTIATTYLLEEENGGTRFTVIETGLEALPEDARQKHLEQDDAGWVQALANLHAYIDGKALPHPQGF
ncbi:MAG: SRPBCC domain-containing protein [Anaerolineae bacterium]